MCLFIATPLSVELARKALEPVAHGRVASLGSVKSAFEQRPFRVLYHNWYAGEVIHRQSTLDRPEAAVAEKGRLSDSGTGPHRNIDAEKRHRR
jgi:hypothetical protein